MLSLIRNTLCDITRISSYIKRLPVINNQVTTNFDNIVTRSFGIFKSSGFINSQNNSFLQPNLPILQQSCGMKIKGKPKLRCKDCFFLKKDERLYVLCKTFGRHKQMAMKKKALNTWILTHATQGKVRAW